MSFAANALFETNTKFAPDGKTLNPNEESFSDTCPLVAIIFFAMLSYEVLPDAL